MNFKTMYFPLIFFHNCLHLHNLCFIIEIATDLKREIPFPNTGPEQINREAIPRPQCALKSECLLF